MPRLRRGSGTLELALTTPMLLGFLLAIVDLGRFITDTNRASTAAAAVADLVSQTETFTDVVNPDAVVSGRELAVVNVAAREVAKPLELFTEGAVIITVIGNPDGRGAQVIWKRRWGRTDIVSRVSVSSLQGITLATGESAVYSEVGYYFHPYILSGRLLGLDDNKYFQTSAVRRPRLGGPTLTAS